MDKSDSPERKKPPQPAWIKGKLDLKWFGDFGFKLSFYDAEERKRTIYIDINVDNDDCLTQDQENCRHDADLALVTSGDQKHSMHTPLLISAGKKPTRRLICNEELANFYETYRKIPSRFISDM